MRTSDLEVSRVIAGVVGIVLTTVFAGVTGAFLAIIAIYG
jgi:hypothetical protein